MNIDFTGKKAIVCGGSRGIGRAIALGFAAAGGDVSICARDPYALEETRSEIAKHGRKSHAASADLAKEDVV
jgi:3-oxoacyl-[acyl-carrier protein] reductase